MPLTGMSTLRPIVRIQAAGSPQLSQYLRGSAIPNVVRNGATTMSKFTGEVREGGGILICTICLSLPSSYPEIVYVV